MNQAWFSTSHMPLALDVSPLKNLHHNVYYHSCLSTKGYNPVRWSLIHWMTTKVPLCGNQIYVKMQTNFTLVLCYTLCSSSTLYWVLTIINSCAYPYLRLWARALTTASNKFMVTWSHAYYWWWRKWNCFKVRSVDNKYYNYVCIIDM